jgi:hypothetical protein
MSKTDDLREFLLAPKPDWMLPVDVSVMANLILLNGADYVGHEVIAARSGVADSKAILRSLGRLSAAGWIRKFKTPLGKIQYTIETSRIPKGKH